MSIARRIAELYEAKMNAVLDRATDPRELVDYSYVQLQELLAEVRRGTAEIAASRRRAQLRITELQRAADRLGEQAGQAMQAGQEDLARQALTRRAAISAQVSRLREQQDSLRAEEEKIGDAGRRLQEKIDAFGMQKEAIKAAYTAARPDDHRRGLRRDLRQGGRRRHGRPPRRGPAGRPAGTGQRARRPAAPERPGGPAATLSDEQLQAQLDRISVRAEVDQELARLRERLAAGAGQGHRTVPHTADLRIEAWAPTREECLAEAVRGLVDSFAVVAAAPPRHTAERRFLASSDDDLLVAVIDEVIYRLDADGEIPVTVAVRPAPEGGVVLVLSLAGLSEAEITGAAPKAASLHDLRCAPDPAGRWSCGITIDV